MTETQLSIIFDMLYEDESGIRCPQPISVLFYLHAQRSASRVVLLSGVSQSISFERLVLDPNGPGPFIKAFKFFLPRYWDNRGRYCRVARSLLLCAPNVETLELPAGLVDVIFKNPTPHLGVLLSSLTLHFCEIPYPALLNLLAEYPCLRQLHIHADEELYEHDVHDDSEWKHKASHPNLGVTCLTMAIYARHDGDYTELVAQIIDMFPAALSLDLSGSFHLAQALEHANPYLHTLSLSSNGSMDVRSPHNTLLLGLLPRFKQLRNLTLDVEGLHEHVHLTSRTDTMLLKAVSLRIEVLTLGQHVVVRPTQLQHLLRRRGALHTINFDTVNPPSPKDVEVARQWRAVRNTVIASRPRPLVALQPWNSTRPVGWSRQDIDDFLSKAAEVGLHVNGTVLDTRRVEDLIHEYSQLYKPTGLLGYLPS